MSSVIKKIKAGISTLRVGIAGVRRMKRPNFAAVNVDMQGKVCVVTGANSGIGKETALSLAHMGATVVLVCRSESRGSKALAEIKQRSGNDSVSLLLADFSSQRQVREVTGAILEQFDRLDVLVNNAGVTPWQWRAAAEDGLELTFAVNHLAPFLLTSLLLDRLKASAPASVRHC